MLFVPTALRSAQVSFLYLQAGGPRVRVPHVHHPFYFFISMRYHRSDRGITPAAQAGVRTSNRLTSINLILRLTTHYTAICSALFWGKLGTFGTIRVLSTTEATNRALAFVYEHALA